MRTTFRVLVGLLAVEVLVQGMAIGFAIAGLGKWVDDGHSATKALFDDNNADFGGKTGFAIHGINGTMIIPILVLLLLIISFFAKVAGGVRIALTLFGLVVLQVVLGIVSHSVPGLITLHVLNAFAIFTFAAMSVVRMGTTAGVGAPAQASTAV